MWYLWKIATLLGLIFISVTSIAIWNLLINRRRNLLHLPGPIPLPLIGNALLFIKGHEFVMSTTRDLVERYRKYGSVLRVHLAFRPNAVIFTPEAYEKILSSNVHITKGHDYRFLWSWLGTGLLTSTGSKWHTRRKMLTPAFHFRILEDFLQVMTQQSDVLCNKILAPLCGKGEVDIFPIVTHCTLDIICETAMGRSVNAQAGNNSDYVHALYKASDIVHQRQKSPWLWEDWLFSLTPSGRAMKNCLSVLHNFTNTVIKERKEEIKSVHEEKSMDDDIAIKRRLAFLDLLIEASKGGTVLSDEDIREEVDTFMFEGHDTTATSMSFTLWLLASHPEIQARCQGELDTIFNGDQERNITSQDLTKMKYLESCLKESLRLYQSVPFMSRILGEDVEFEGVIIPAKTNVVFLNFLLHRDPKSFPDPNKFDPERFSGQEERRHPYAYVPFSAGPRNCIGQKFAMMEAKVVVSSVLRKYNLNTTMRVDDIPLLAEVVLRPKNGLNVSIEERI